ncbi:MAG: hypothetical protein ABWZ62_02250 [Actinomycetota bacterium]
MATQHSNHVRSALTRSVALARAVGRRVLAAAAGETGRRLARAAALTVLLAVVVTALYDRGEVPTAAARQAVGPAAAGNQGGSATHGTAPRKDPAEVGGLRGRVRAAPVGERPAAVAAAWYAARNGVPRARVKPLQQDRLSATEVRVLVLADHGHGRLRTALVRLRHGPDGWRVR